MRRPLKKKRSWTPDLKYGSETLTRFINAVMWDGKKDTARTVVYDALSVIEKGEANPLETFESALRNVSPLMEVRSRRIGGANYQVPREVPQARRLALSFKRREDGVHSGSDEWVSHHRALGVTFLFGRG